MAIYGKPCKIDESTLNVACELTPETKAYYRKKEFENDQTRLNILESLRWIKLIAKYDAEVAHGKWDGTLRPEYQAAYDLGEKKLKEYERANYADVVRTS